MIGYNNKEGDKKVKKCHRCGAENKDEYKICIVCSKRIDN